MEENRSSGILRVVGFALVLLGIILMQEITTTITATMELETRALISTVVFFGTFLIMYLAVVGFMNWEGRSDITELGIQTDENTVSHLIVGAIAGIASALVVYLVAMYFGGTLTPIENIDADLIINEIIITTPIAFFEELCYRGYLMTRLEQVSNRGFAIIASSFWFGLLHFGWWVPLGEVPLHLILIFTFNMTLGGIILGLSYYMSGKKLWVAIAFHFAWNMLAYILFPVYPRETVVLPEIFQIEWGLVTIPAFIFGLSLIWLLLDIFKKRE
jgi:membrane protease YdiL (CAAX protease family)